MFPLYDDNPTTRTPLITYALIAINVLAFLWVQHLPPLPQQVVMYQRGFVPARIMQLREDAPIQIPIDVVVNQGFWGPQVQRRMLELPPSPRELGLSLITCMFLHGGWLHLLGNMWFLWLFGNNVEDRLGPIPYLFLYLVGGLVASLSHWVVTPTSTVPVVGASGAIAAALGAYAITWPWARVKTLVVLIIFVTIVDVPALLVLGLWFVAQVLAGQESLRDAASGGVAWWAHVGGFVAGMALMPLLSMVVNPEPPPPDRRSETTDWSE